MDESDGGVNPHILFYLDHEIRDSSRNQDGISRVISKKKMLYVDMHADGSIRGMEYAPYLDFRPLKKMIQILPKF